MPVSVDFVLHGARSDESRDLSQHEIRPAASKGTEAREVVGSRGRSPQEQEVEGQDRDRDAGGEAHSGNLRLWS